MSGTRQLKIEVLGDTKGVSKAFGDVENDAGKMSSGLGGKIGAAGVVLGGFALAGGAAAVGIGLAVNDMGINLDTMRAKAQVVFGDSLGDVKAWADENAAAMGLSGTKATALAANMADLLKPMGFTTEQAAGMSTEMTGLSGALSAWSQGQFDAAEVSDIMTKAMLGETDGLKALGISISGVEIESVLAANGQDQLTGAALAQAKALAVQQLILEKSTDAQTAWSDGSMDAVKAANEQKASIEGIKESFVNALYPAIQRITPLIADASAWIGERLPGAMAKAQTWIEENWPKIRAAIEPTLTWFMTTGQEVIEVVASAWEQFGGRIMSQVMNAWKFIQEAIESALQVIQGLVDVVLGVLSGDWSRAWDGIKAVLGGAWDFMTNLVRYALQSIGLLLDMGWEVIKGLTRSAWDWIKSQISGAIDGVVGFVTGIPGRISSTVSGLWKGIETGMTTAKEWVDTKVDDLVTTVTGLPARLAGKFSGAFDGIKDAFRSAINGLIRMWNNLSFTFPSFDGDWNGPLPGGDFTVGGWKIDTGNIPLLAGGGLVFGPTLLVAGDNANASRDPEVIAPLSKLADMLGPARTAASSVTNNYTIHAANDSRALVRELELMAWRSGAR